MLTLGDVRRLFEFHHWAGALAFEAIGPLTAEQLDRKWGGSFGTGRGLLRHIVGAERLWITRWNGTSPRAIAEFPAAYTGADFRADWQQVAMDERAYLEGLTAQRLEQPLTYVNLKGETWTYPLSEIFVHVVNHGTYHRGQITHLLRDLGMPAPSTDWLLFIQEKST